MTERGGEGESAGPVELIRAAAERVRRAPWERAFRVVAPWSPDAPTEVRAAYYERAQEIWAAERAERAAHPAAGTLGVIVEERGGFRMTYEPPDPATGRPDAEAREVEEEVPGEPVGWKPPRRLTGLFNQSHPWLGL